MKIKGIPANETIWVIQKTESGNTYYVTAKQQRDKYFIYKLVDGAAVKLGSGKNPAKLTEQYAK